MLRTHTCGELRRKDAGKKVKLCGWVDTIRGHGKLNFIDLRDRYGKIQVVLIGKHELKPESVVRISGEVQQRKKGTENKDLDTGDIEVFSKDIEVFSRSKALPFEIGDKKVGEDVRLEYRYLDLRGKKMQDNLILRDKLYKAIYDFMRKKGFINVDTPILGKSTPEGARDYIVPSRIHAGKFYALPQSPQLFKQVLMVSGFDRYFQIARCFRDEDLRADRQPEFTQLDVEMSFVDVDDIIKIMEELWVYVFKEVLGVNLKTPFPRISYGEAMKKYKTDSPDLRKEKQSDRLAFAWVVDFPMFEWSNEDKRWYSVHHPFTMPSTTEISDPSKVKAKAYDLVLNGSEIGGGSVRIHNLDLQREIFKILGIGEKESEEKFGFLLDALSFGAPPHGGIAFGLDRIVQVITKSESIRDVIAFPKNRTGQDAMLDAPSAVEERQLTDVHIKLNLPKKKGNK